MHLDIENKMNVHLEKRKVECNNGKRQQLMCKKMFFFLTATKGFLNLEQYFVYIIVYRFLSRRSDIE
jgi:hypothetical protein